MANAILLGASGVFAILLPASVLSLYGVTADPAILLMAQYAGMGSLVIGLVAWFSREVKDGKAQKAILLAFFITYVTGIVVSVSGTISGAMGRGWAVVAIYLVFALAYGYMLLKKEYS